VATVQEILVDAGDRFAVLREMIRNLFSKPATICYPFEKVPVPEGFRGRVEYIDENCIGCGRCFRVCPAEAITMVEGPREMEVKGKKLMRKKKPEIAIYRCIRCGLCEEYCNQEPKAIRLTCEFSGAGEDREVVVG
jgi:formate hydrogenlyase subunit 6/NADH:ubiquinone oxidoreductase subunit I